MARVGGRGRPREYCDRANGACRKLRSSLGTTLMLLMKVSRYATVERWAFIRGEVFRLTNMRAVNARGPGKLPPCPR